jgi:hypothetical protein
MGCFSYMCSGCEQPIWSDSYSGEHVIMFLIEAGECLEWMQGQYNSYGQVFRDDGLKSSQEWKSKDWSAICALQFNSNVDDGLAVYHSGCYDKGCTFECSDSDPDQGWGYQEYDGQEKYAFPTEGGFNHGLKRKPEPNWTTAEEI